MVKRKNNIEYAEPKLSASEWFKKELNKARKGKFLMLIMLPGLIYFIIFQYITIGGLLIAFKDYSSRLGLCGLGAFYKIFKYAGCMEIYMEYNSAESVTYYMAFSAGDYTGLVYKRASFAEV